MKKFFTIFLFFGLNLYLTSPVIAQASNQRVNVNPSVGENITLPTSSIFWFGQVDPDENYMDVRVGYNPNATSQIKRLQIFANIFDRILRNNDELTVYIDTNPSAVTISNSSYKFVGRLGNTFQSYQGNSGIWESVSIPFSITPGWRGNGIGDNIDDAGWSINFSIPFSSFGLSTAPTEGTVWKLAIAVNDFDEDGVNTPSATWPFVFDEVIASDWNEMHFGLPVYSPEPNENNSTITIAPAFDAMIGGGNVCSEGFRDTRWTDFGNKNWNNEEISGTTVNIQNQVDTADWLCYSKYFIQIPLSDIPVGKVIVGATLNLKQFGNAGNCDPDVYPDCAPQNQPFDSIVHAFQVDNTNWQDSGITWNNAPKPLHNTSVTRFPPIWDCSVTPCDTYENPPRDILWDISEIINTAYQQGEQFATVALYSSDAAYHSGKYFYHMDYNFAAYRPSVELIYGDNSTTTQSPTQTPPIPGDANSDGDVDGIDYVIWLNHYNQGAEPNDYSSGNFNADSIVDGLDYVIWLNNYTG